MQMTDCDRQEGTATAALSSSKQCSADDFVKDRQRMKTSNAPSSEQCKIDGFAMDGRQNMSKGTENDGDRCDWYNRELTAEENTWWAKEMQQLEAWASDNGGDLWADLRVPNHCPRCNVQLFMCECFDVILTNVPKRSDSCKEMITQRQETRTDEMATREEAKRVYSIKARLSQ